MKPEYLYKFISLEDESHGKVEKNEKKFYSLSNNMIWFSTADQMNDPYEFRGIYVDYNQLKKDGITEDEVKSLRRLFEEDFLLASFASDVVCSFPMWAHYANNHKGFCIKYKVIDDKKIQEVKYVKQRENITDGIKGAIQAFEIMKDPTIQEEKKQFVMGLMDMYMRVIDQNFTIKHESWKYEKEYRIIVERKNKKELFGENVLAKDVGLNAEAIYVGYKCDVYERIKKIADQLGITCYKCRPQEKDFMIFSELI